MISVSFILLVAVGVAMAGLGIFTLLNNWRHRTNIYFAGICFSLLVWIVANYLADADPTRSLLWTRLTFFAVDLTAFWGLLFANTFPKESFSSRRWFYTPAAITTALVSVISFLPWFIPRIEIVDGVSTVVTGPLYFMFVVYYFCYLVALVGLLIYTFRNSHGADRIRVEYVLAGIAIMSVFTSTTNLVLPLITGDNRFAGFGSYFTLIFTGFTSYAIVRHRLFNIRRLVARSVAYVLLVATLAGIYGLVVFGATNILFPNEQTNTSATVLNTIVAVVLALTFQPLKNFFEQITDRIFYRNRYNSQELLNEVGQILVMEFMLDNLLRKTLAKICQELKISQGQFYIYNHEHIYKVQLYGAAPRKMITAPHLQSLRRRVLVADELSAGNEKRIMDEFGFRFAMHLRTKEEFVGYLLLGDKLSGDVYNEQDIRVLQILGQELAVAISNAKAYEEIEHFNATLQGKVDDATKRLRQANTHLKELDQAKDEFISMASHQLRTPLTAIKGYLSMLQEGDAGKMTKNQLEFVNYSYGGAQRMVNLISDLLNVSRMSAGKFMIEKVPVDLTKVVGEEVFQLQSHAQAKNLKLTYVQPKRPVPMMNLDENKTRQVIMNFIDNAVYYTREGSVTVTLEKVGDHVEMRVKDTGIGVPKEAQKKLFTKFYRAENAQTVRPDGTGLGLFLAKRVIEDQGGSIIFETTEGKGSTFGFSFPIKEPTTQKAEPTAPVDKLPVAK